MVHRDMSEMTRIASHRMTLLLNSRFTMQRLKSCLDLLHQIK